jgi:DNA helicase-2/ATP-dependent DNA helicase PcrA
LNENEYIENKTSQKEKERIIISTIHRAKGLQWTSVFVPMLENGFFPSFQNMENEEDLEEERRVFYVSVTRAKKDLFLLTSKFTGKRNELESSLFIQELNPNTYEKILL